MDVGAAAHVFVDDLDTPELSGDDLHHMQRVLRLRPGELVTVSDGVGGWRSCRLGPAGALDPDGERQTLAPPVPVVTVAFALTKGERPEWAVQKLTEVGVDRILPYIGANTVVRWDPAKAAHQLERLRAVARAAAMQSRRAWLPAVGPVSSFREAVAAAGPAAAMAHPGGAAPTLARPAVLVGPEGGFTDAELSVGLPTVDLGPTVLRAETAAVAAGVLLCALRAGLVDAPTGRGE